ncbi:MAG: type II CAAX endopeptidase family protein [Peptococcaceae bacterium]|nr:type II CAAX endopeptidase family protein [Peptococcaceae bacterium]
MEQAERQVRAPWSARQALAVLVAINLLELGLSRALNLATTGVWQLLLWTSLDAALNIGLILLFMRWRHQKGSVALGLTGRRWLHAVIFGLGAGLVAAAVALLVGDLLVELTGHAPEWQPVQELLTRPSSLLQTVALIGAASVLVPLKEEIMFRGFLYPALRDRMGIVGGILVTSLLFALVHGDLMRALPLFIGGVILNVAYQKTGSLYAAIVGHGVWNLLMSILAYTWR